MIVSIPSLMFVIPSQDVEKYMVRIFDMKMIPFDFYNLKPFSPVTNTDIRTVLARRIVGMKTFLSAGKSIKIVLI